MEQTQVITKRELSKVKNKLKQISHCYRTNLAEKTGLHKNTVGAVFNDKLGINDNTRLKVLEAANDFIIDYKHREQEVFSDIKNSTK